MCRAEAVPGLTTFRTCTFRNSSNPLHVLTPNRPLDSVGAAPYDPISGTLFNGDTDVTITSAEGRNLGLNTPAGNADNSLAHFKYLVGNRLRTLVSLRARIGAKFIPEPNVGTGTTGSLAHELAAPAGLQWTLLYSLSQVSSIGATAVSSARSVEILR